MGTPDPRNAVRCSACTALVSAGASFCPQCGDPLAPAEAGEAGLGCPACPGAEPMASWRLQPTSRQPQGYAVHGCRRCGGVWIDRTTLVAMLDSAAQQGAGDGRASTVPRRALSVQTKVVYRSCSVCKHAMARRNFARISGVIVDECRVHGTFFDAGELEDVLTFVRSGGLVLARRRETEELAREARRAEEQKMQARHPLMSDGNEPLSIASDTLSGEPDLGVAFVRWSFRWIRNMFR
jgi:Zn-finger nucleic acid-binding protein